MGLESRESPETATRKSKKKIKREKNNGDGDMVPVQNEQQETSKESIEQHPVDVQIKVINSHTEKTLPIVGYFPSGFKFRKNDMGSDLEELGHQDNLSPSPLRPDVRFYRNAQRAKIEKSDKWKSSERMELVVAPAGSNVEFVGTSYKGEAVAAQLCTYALGVLDKRSQTLKIMPIAGNKIFRLEPKIRGLDTSDKEPAVVENSETPVNSAYLTKRTVNKLKSQKLMEMVDNPELQGDLSKTIDSIVINKEALENVNVANVRNIPPHNMSAATPQEAYPLNRIIMEGEWDYLEDVSGIFKVETGVAPGAYPTFVLQRIYKLQDMKNDEEKQTVSRILSFITHLIKFKDMHSLNGRSSAKNHRFPSILKQRFAHLFDSAASKQLSVDKINLLISYVLVLTLYVDDFRTDPTDIAKDLKMSPVDLSMHFGNLGCKRARENKVLFTLPTPISFPAERRKRRR